MIGTCYAGPIEDGEQLLRPLRASRTPLLDLVGPAPYAGFQSALDSTVLHGWNYYWKSTHLPELRDDLIDVIVEHEDPDRVREAYGDSVYDRLVDVKTTYDPDNVFHHNQNIRPLVLKNVVCP